jgi:hypothetical protein
MRATSADPRCEVRLEMRGIVYVGYVMDLSLYCMIIVHTHVDERETPQ